MSKKLLNEAQMRRFMGLAGIESTIVTNKVNEWYKTAQNEGEYNKDEEEVMQEEDELPPEEEEAEEAPLDAAPEMDMDADMPPVEDEPAPEAEAALDPQALAMELIDALAPVFEKHGVELTASEDAPAAEPDVEMDMDAEMPPMDAAPEGGEDLGAAPEEEEIEETNLQLTQEEIVSEVARRVVNRIRKAKRAKNSLDEALGNK